MNSSQLTVVTDFIAGHAVIVLLGVTLAMTCMTAVLWRLIAGIGPQLTDWFVTRRIAWSLHRAIQRMQSAPLLGTALGTTARGSLRVGRYLGVHALVSFVVAIVAAASLAELAEQLGLNAIMVRFDIALSHSLSQHLSRSLLASCAVFTHLGDGVVLTMVVIVVAVVLLLRREVVLACAFMATTALGGLMTRMLKWWFARSRPLYDHGFSAVEGWSFPSGHASGSMLVYGLIGYLLVRHSGKQSQVPIVIGTMMLVVFVGASRVLLQVHYFSDVLAGWIVATFWMSLCIAGLEIVRRRAAVVASTSSGTD